MGFLGFGKKTDLRPTDPVCGKKIDPFHAGGSYMYQGREYKFCSEEHMKDFRASPAKFIGLQGQHLQA